MRDARRPSPLPLRLRPAPCALLRPASAPCCQWHCQLPALSCCWLLLHAALCAPRASALCALCSSPLHTACCIEAACCMAAACCICAAAQCTATALLLITGSWQSWVGQSNMQTQSDDAADAVGRRARSGAAALPNTTWWTCHRGNRRVGINWQNLITDNPGS
jgi:hypothetical protein